MRRASLSISTNAIVVLIVAVIMLGLIIGLVTEGFNLVSDQFFNSIVENEPEAVQPTFQTPVTLSQISKVGQRGDPMGLKINILNTQSTALKEAAPRVKCLNQNVVVDYETDRDSQQVFNKTIDVNEVGDYVYTFTIADNAPSREHLCKIEVTAADPTDGDEVYTTAVKPAEFKIIIR